MSRRVSVLLSFLAVVAFVVPASGQHFPTDSERLELIQTRVEEGRATGIVVGVLEADGTRRIQSFGDAGPGALPLSAETIFEIGSISKVFTGILLADMAAEGLLAVDDAVQAHVPGSVTIPSRPGQVIRLVDLSTHRSALPRLPDNMSPADRSNPYADYTVQMMYDFLSGHTLRRDVGSQFEYSNLAVGLLGHVLALKAGEGYEALVAERILRPLGMENSGITITPEMERNFAKGHDQAGNVVPYWDLPTLAGAGALRSDMNDMLDFIEANVGEPGTDLERSMRASHEARQPAGAMSVGLNWMTRSVGDDRVVWHNGGTAGFRTFAGFDPDRGVGAVVLTNSAHGADDIGFHLINDEVPLTPAPVAQPEPTGVEAERAFAARYGAAIAWVNLIAAGDFEEAGEQVNEAVAAQLGSEQLEQAWGQLSPQLGAMESLGPKSQSMEQAFHLVVLKGVFANGTFDVQVYMADDHSVVGFFIRPPSE